MVECFLLELGKLHALFKCVQQDDMGVLGVFVQVEHAPGGTGGVVGTVILLKGGIP